MSYQVLARKWRPAKFEQMVGQSHVLLALTNALSQQRLHHAYLFTGTRGVGKTSLARLFAKGLNCEQGVTATPCGQCASCVEIAQGRFVDLIEVDAASRTKVDDTRELLDNVQYRPSRGRYKVYLIDEVHMLSRSSFNALLKTLEEPPEHVKFLLATTDPQKLPVTVLSRCLQFNLKSLSQQQISDQLEYVLTQEQLPFETQALQLLAKAANGSMRDALSLTDQAIAFSSGQVNLEQVQTMLGSIDQHQVIALLQALCDAKVKPLMEHIAKVLSFGADADEVLRSLLELLHQITLTQFAPAAAQQSLFSEQIVAFAKAIPAEQIQLYYQLLLSGRKDLAYAPDPKSGLEMALLRAVAFVPEKPTQRWAVEHPAKLDLTQQQEVIETGPKPNEHVQTEALEKPDLESKKLDNADVKVGGSTGTDLNTSSDTNANLTHANSNDASSNNANAEAETTSELEALNAEQAILLSQASSMGYQELQKPVPAQVELDNKPTATQIETSPETSTQTSTENDAQQSVQTPIDDESCKTESVPSAKLESNTDSASSSNLKPRKGQETVSESNTALSQDMPVDTAQGDSDSAASMDDFYMAMSQASEQSQDGDYYDAQFEQQAASQDLPMSIESTSQLTSNDPSASLKTDNAIAAEDDLDLDDVLDAVLASNELLIADIDSHHAKEEAEKKAASSKSVEIKKPIAKPEVVNLTSNIDGSVSGCLDANLSTSSNDDVSAATVDSQRIASQASISDKAATKESGIDNPQSTQTHTDDRPPWEPAPAGELADVKVTQNNDEPKLTDVSVTTTDTPAQVTPAQVTPAQVSLQQLSTTGHQVTGEQQDLQWYRVMSEIKVGGRVRQLGVNSVNHSLQSPIKLTLKPNQKHLAAPVAIEQLEAALTEYFAESTTVEIEVGSVDQRETPLELRKRFHQELTTQATHSLLNDSKVQWMIQSLGAELDQDSVLYPTEQLTQIAARLPASNANDDSSEHSE
ncbi:DNA polymerase III subunit gamma/tau [Shewanella maritima]|uniref:DNA polymerase III subunit gamma/tau n=1 Tax=Shewanella maritima TaxID=2520507 RepID=UPI003736EE44